MKGSALRNSRIFCWHHAEALSDRIGIMKDGKMLITGTPQELMKITSTDKFEEAFISIVKGAI